MCLCWVFSIVGLFVSISILTVNPQGDDCIDVCTSFNRIPYDLIILELAEKVSIKTINSL